MSNITDDTLPSATERNVQLGFYIFTLVIGFCGNSLVIAVIAGKRHKKISLRSFYLQSWNLWFQLCSTFHADSHLRAPKRGSQNLVFLSIGSTSGINLLFLKHVLNHFYGYCSLQVHYKPFQIQDEEVQCSHLDRLHLEFLLDNNVTAINRCKSWRRSLLRELAFLESP